MESGSIAKWNLKEGDRFEPGTSLCDVETDKATVSFDATEEGYIAKILIASGDIKVGQPLLVTVEEAADVAAFANFALTGAAPVAAAPAPVAAAPVAAAPVAAPVAAAPSSSSAALPAGVSPLGRVFASPLAKKLVREAGDDLQRVAAVAGQGSGPNGRLVAADVREALKVPRTAAATAAPAAAPATTAAPAAAVAKPAAVAAANIAGVFEDFVVTEAHQQLASRLAAAKQAVPHYYLTVELNLAALLALRQTLNANLAAAAPKAKDPAAASPYKEVAVLDLLVKAAAHAMRSVPDVNAAWMDSFVRQYHQVDINVVMSAAPAASAVTPVVRDVNNKGLGSITELLASYEDRLAKNEALTAAETADGTFTIHNVGAFGVRSAAPIVLPPQAAALALGAVYESVIPKAAEGDAAAWEVAPMMQATMAVDHRVVDGAVSAQWLAAFKNVVENPVNLLM